MTKKKTPAPKRAGTANDHAARLARVLEKAGSDPASMLLMISVMERILSERHSRRGKKRRAKSY